MCQLPPSIQDLENSNFALSCRFAVDNSNELVGGGLSNVVGQEGVDPKLNQHLTLCV